RPAGRYCAILLDGACHGGGRTMTAVVVIGAGGLALAQRLGATPPEGPVPCFAPRIARADVRFADRPPNLPAPFPRRAARVARFARGEAIVASCAAGIVIRSLAPLLADKRTEPPVVAVAEDGSVAVPLLGGHHGANDLARRIVALTGGTAAVTTAGDLQLGLALDDPPPGWRVANPDAAKAITAALLAGENVELVIEAAEPDCECLRRAPFVCRGGSQPRPSIARTSPAVVVTDLAGPTGDARLVLHPATLAVGVGCERGVAAAEVADLVRRCLAEAT